MSRSLQLFQVYYRLHSDGILRFRFCLAYNGCHSSQVLIRSLIADGFELNSFDYVNSVYIRTYR